MKLKNTIKKIFRNPIYLLLSICFLFSSAYILAPAVLVILPLSSGNVDTDNPSDEEIKRCIQLMQINEDLEIQAKGYYLFQGFSDITHHFKFLAKTDTLEKVFHQSLFDQITFKRTGKIVELEIAKTNTRWAESCFWRG